MVNDNGIFRKVSLDRLSSPEKLDQLLPVTDRKGWLALLASGQAEDRAVVLPPKAGDPATQLAGAPHGSRGGPCDVRRNRRQ